MVTRISSKMRLSQFAIHAGRLQRHPRWLLIRAASVLLLFLCTFLAACRPAPAETAATLVLEEHALAAAPVADTFSFEPVEGSQEEVLARHSAEREKTYQQNTTTVQGNPALLPNGEASNLAAMLTTSEQNPPEQSVQVLLAGAPIFTAPAGLPSPLFPLQGLWSYGGHWALEILFTNETMWAGQVYVDGDLLNEAKGYDEAFGFQLLGGKPFYFYQKEGHAGYSYDGQETDLEYDQIPHYFCCGETALNPVQAEDMVAFFAQKGEEWYYVELGNFE